MIHLHMLDDETGRSADAEIPSSHGPALRSTIADHRNELGERSSGSHQYDKEDALTRAMSAFNTLSSMINQTIPNEDPNYE